MYDLIWVDELLDEPNECPRWPADGDTSTIIFEVVDEKYSLLYADDNFSAVFDECAFDWCINSDLPIASGVYRMQVSFWHFKGDRGFFPEWEDDFGLNCLKLERVGNEGCYEN